VAKNMGEHLNDTNSEIERIEWMINEIRKKGIKAVPEFDRNRGIDEKKAIEMLNNQLNYFRTKNGNI
jgi:hypothetical protein